MVEEPARSGGPGGKSHRKAITYEIDSNGCHVCTSHAQFHFGHIAYGGFYRRMHRYIFAKYHGPFDSRLCILHKCDKPSCINPEHLYAGTQKDNMRDRAVRLRNPLQKLTPDQVREIRSSDEMQTKLAERYGVGPGAVNAIKGGRTWKHLL